MSAGKGRENPFEGDWLDTSFGLGIFALACAAGWSDPAAATLAVWADHLDEVIDLELLRTIWVELQPTDTPPSRWSRLRQAVTS